jgi:hypothetical protein
MQTSLARGTAGRRLLEDYTTHDGRSLSPLEQRVLEQTHLHQTIQEAFTHKAALAQRQFGSLYVQTEQGFAESMDEFAAIRNEHRDPWAQKLVAKYTDEMAADLHDSLAGTLRTTGFRIGEIAQRPFDLSERTKPGVVRRIIAKGFGKGSTNG